jgi:predicted DNA-binding transcriptional regulator AlpA
MTAKEYAAKHNLSTATVYRYIREGKLQLPLRKYEKVDLSIFTEDRNIEDLVKITGRARSHLYLIKTKHNLPMARKPDPRPKIVATMAKEQGVSRQTIYNRLDKKDKFA